MTVCDCVKGSRRVTVCQWLLKMIEACDSLSFAVPEGRDL